MRDRWLGLVALAASLTIALVWVPLDVETGLIEKVRRSVQIGDAFAPTIAAFIIGIGAVLVLVARTDSLPDVHSTKFKTPSLTENFLYALSVLLIVAIAMGLMRYAGPGIVGWVKVDNVEYRLLRDTVPWKYIGFVLGGTFLVTACCAWTEKKLKWLHVLIGILTTLVLIALYDFPFDDLLLPPNGDV